MRRLAAALKCAKLCERSCSTVVFTGVFGPLRTGRLVVCETILVLHCVRGHSGCFRI